MCGILVSSKYAPTRHEILIAVLRSARDFAAWIGLGPRQDSTGGKQKLEPISKRSDRYLRRLLVVGAHAVLRRADDSRAGYDPNSSQQSVRSPTG
jgi:transposase